MKAYVFLTTKPGTSEEVIRHLQAVAKVKGVKSIDSVYGRFDAIVTVDAASLEEMGELVYKVIEKIPNVTRSETALVLSRKSK
jgi:DNA-binding Lrp family transcriptional regulator